MSAGATVSEMQASHKTEQGKYKVQRDAGFLCNLNTREEHKEGRIKFLNLLPLELQYKTLKQAAESQKLQAELYWH